MSSVEPSEKIDLLVSSLERNLETFKSAHDLLNLSKEQLKNEGTFTPLDIRLKKRNYIVDSFKLDKSHKEYKDWESETRLQFIKEDITNYNQVVGKIAKVNQKLNESSNSYEALAKTIKIPDFTVSIKTLENYGDEKLLKLGKLYGTTNLQLEQLFSLNPGHESKLLFPDFSIIQRLINIEFRLRVEKRVHLEILMLMKNKIQTQNRTWTVRDNQLKEFFDIKVQQMIESVEMANAEDSKAKDEEDDDEEDESESESEGDEGEADQGPMDSEDDVDEERDTINIEKLSRAENDGAVSEFEENIEKKRSEIDRSEVVYRHESEVHTNETEPSNQNEGTNTQPLVESDNDDEEMLH